MFIVWVWALRRWARGVPLLASPALRPLPPAHWGAGTILLVVGIYLGANVAADLAGSALAGRREANHVGAEAEAKAAPRAGKAAERSALEIILLTGAASLLFCALAPPLLWRLAKVGPRDLGLFGDRWPLQIWVGALTALLATPATYAIQAVALGVWRANEHPVQEMMVDQFTPAAAALAMFTTAILAPLVEETMFRGILQRWLTRVFAHRPPATAAEPSISPLEVSKPPTPGTQDWEPGAWPAIVATSLIFAGMHGQQWPSPIALFVFSMILGGVYQRTGSLLAAMVAHGAFNGFSTLLLIVQLSAHRLAG